MGLFGLSRIAVARWWRGVVGEMLAVALLAGFGLLIADGSALAIRAPLSTTIVTTDGVVPPNELLSVTDQCPVSYPHPVGPMFGYRTGASMVGSLALAASYPRGKRGWVTQVKNATSQPQSGIMGVVCLRADATFAYPRTRNTVAGPTGYSPGEADCPRSAPNAVDNYFGVQSATDSGSLLLAEAYPFSTHKGSGFVTGVSAFAHSAFLFFAGSVCTSLRSATSYFRATVAVDHSSGGTLPCPRRAPVAVSGSFYALPPGGRNDGEILMGYTYPHSRNTWIMGVENLADHTVRYAVGAVCVGQ